MIKIIKVATNQTGILSKIGRETFMDTYVESAPKKEIKNYLLSTFNKETVTYELENPLNNYHFIFYNDTLAGYSNINFNKPYASITEKNTTYLSRLYILKEFHSVGLGKELFNFNIGLAKQNSQKGMCLAVWTENQKAIHFYTKIGFQKIGEFDYKISENHANPNYMMHLKF